MNRFVTLSTLFVLLVSLASCRSGKQAYPIELPAVAIGKAIQAAESDPFNVAVGLGTFIQVLDTSIANVAVPYIAGNLSVSADQGTWVITSFSASNAIVLPLTGWLSDYFGCCVHADHA